MESAGDDARHGGSVAVSAASRYIVRIVRSGARARCSCEIVIVGHRIEASVAVDGFAGARTPTEPREHSSDVVAAPAAPGAAVRVVALKRWRRAARTASVSAVSTFA